MEWTSACIEAVRGSSGRAASPVQRQRCTITTDAGPADLTRSRARRRTVALFERRRSGAAHQRRAAACRHLPGADRLRAERSTYRRCAPLTTGDTGGRLSPSSARSLTAVSPRGSPALRHPNSSCADTGGNAKVNDSVRPGERRFRPSPTAQTWCRVNPEHCRRSLPELNSPPPPAHPAASPAETLSARHWLDRPILPGGARCGDLSRPQPRETPNVVDRPSDERLVPWWSR